MFEVVLLALGLPVALFAIAVAVRPLGESSAFGA